MANLPEDFFDTSKDFPRCTVCQKQYYLKFDPAYFVAKIVSITGDLICSTCVRSIASGVVGTQIRSKVLK
jgi:hypothetical protein